MEFRYVSIGKTVPNETLETALVKAAEEVGWKSKVEDNFDVSYRLGSVEESRTYRSTSINLTVEARLAVVGRFLPFIKKEVRTMFVGVPHKNPTDNFTVFVGGRLGDASDKEVSEYLKAVSKYLQAPVEHRNGD